MRVDNNRFVFSKVGRYGKRFHIFSGGWLARSFCGRGPAKAQNNKISNEEISATCKKMYQEISHSALAQMFLGF